MEKPPPPRQTKEYQYKILIVLTKSDFQNYTYTVINVEPRLDKLSSGTKSEYLGFALSQSCKQTNEF